MTHAKHWVTTVELTHFAILGVTWYLAALTRLTPAQMDGVCSVLFWGTSSPIYQVLSSDFFNLGFQSLRKVPKKFSHSQHGTKKNIVAGKRFGQKVITLLKRQNRSHKYKFQTSNIYSFSFLCVIVLHAECVCECMYALTILLWEHSWSEVCFIV